MKHKEIDRILLAAVVLLLAVVVLLAPAFISSPVEADPAAASVGESPLEAKFLIDQNRGTAKKSAASVTSSPLGTSIEPLSPSDELTKKLNSIVRKPLYRRAEWGVDIRSVEDDISVFGHNQDKAFPPASNAKLFTTAAALDRLGPDFRFRTRLTYEGNLNPNRRLQGDLVVVGRGDPDLSDNISELAGHFFHLDRMVERVKEAGIEVVDGDIIGDDSYFTYAPYGEGWTISDLSRDYGAPISALSFTNNLITLSVRPGRKIGQPVHAYVYPSESLLTVSNRAKTVRRGRTGRIQWSKTPGTDLVSLRGQLPVNGDAKSQYFLVQDPALYTARLLRERLIKGGVKVTGAARARHSGDDLPPRPAHLLYVHESLPLLEVIGFTNKKSQNLYAEIILRTLGAEVKGIGSDEAGLEVVYEFLAEAGVDRSMADLYDGSGLSRRNLITPRAETLLLRHMAAKPYFGLFLDSLSVSGLDGTLRGRMIQAPAFQRVFAKTGTLQNVTTLGGYVRTESGKMLAFSILINNHPFSQTTAKRAIDQICNTLAKF